MSAVDQLNAQAPVPAPEPQPVAPAPIETPSAPAVSAIAGVGSAELKAGQSRRDRMAAHFASQPKVRVRVTRNTFAQINGYSVRIQAGQSVMVPVQFEKLLLEAGRI